MRKTIDTGVWLRLLAVAVLYFAGYTALRHVSFASWQLSAGWRLTCLLLTPYRYWPALVFGEMLSMAKISYDCFSEFGPVYALVKLVPRIALAMPIVRWCRQRQIMFGPKLQLRMGVVVLCAFAVSLVLASINFFLIWITPDMLGEPRITLDVLPRYFLGQYLGVLTVMPVALMAWQIIREDAWKASWTRLCASRLAMDSATLVLPALGLLIWMAIHITGDMGDAARIAMFLPVAALAMRHGWRGAALGGSLASIAIAIVMPAPNDPATMQAEVFMAFAITTLLVLGARIATLDEQKKKERLDGRLALQAAQQGLYMGERRMQHAADTIEQIGDALYSAHERLLGHLRAFMPVTDERGLVKQGIAAQNEVFRLADGMYPRALTESGLSHVLRLGSIMSAFDRADVAYSGQVSGSDLASLTPSTRLAVYRLACEAAVYLYEQATLLTVHLRVRSGVTKGRRWVVLRMESGHRAETLDLMPPRMACEQFASRLGTSGQGINAIHDLVRIYGGMVHVRSMAQGTRLALLVHDAMGVSGRVN